MTTNSTITHIEQIDFSLLVPYAKNARKHNTKQIAQLMKVTCSTKIPPV